MPATMAGPALKRARFDGDAAAEESVLEAMKTVAKVPDFLRYSEQLNATLDKDKILRVGSMWRDIQTIFGGIPAFTQSQAERLFHQLVDKQGPLVWPRQLTPGEVKTYVPSIARQFRTMARHIAQAKLKNSSWLAQLFVVVESQGAMASVPPREDSPDVEVLAVKQAIAPSSSSSGNLPYCYGYDAEYRMAWRCLPDSTAKEFAKPFYKPGADPGDCCYAVFSDKEEVPIRALTVSELLLEREIKTKQGSGPLWTGVWQKGKIYISYRTDRSPILIMFQEGGGGGKKDQQLCQISIKHWGDPSEQVVTKIPHAGSGSGSGNGNRDGRARSRSSSSSHHNIRSSSSSGSSSSSS